MSCGAVTLEVLAISPESCSGGGDEDLDGATDCFDTECFNRDGCPAGLPGDNCSSAVTVDGAGWEASFNTCSFANDFATSGAAGCKTHGVAGDVVTKVVAAEAGTYRVTFDSGAAGPFGAGNFDSIINVVKSATCPTTPTSFNSCVVSADAGDPEKVDFTAQAGDTFWVLVDGYSSGCGPGKLKVTRLMPENCGDGIDNDGDGETDCADVLDCNGADRAEPLADCPTLTLACESDVAIPSLPYNDNNRDLCDTVRGLDFADDDVCEDYIDETAGGVTYSYTAPVDQTVRVTAVPSGELDLVLNLTRFCNPSGPTGCVAGSDGFSQEVTETTLAAGETVYIPVNLYPSFFGAECGPFNLAVEAIDSP